MAASPTYTDRALFLRIAEGNEDAFREIFGKYGPVLHPFAFHIIKNEAIAREIVQEVFLKVWLKRRDLPQIEMPSAWLYRIASNIALTHFRRQQLEEKVMQTIRDEAQTVDDDPVSSQLSLKHTQELIEKAVLRLPPQRQRIFRMSRESGLSRKEIAKELGISENTVRNQLAISLGAIQAFLERESGYLIPLFFLLLPSAL